MSVASMARAAAVHCEGKWHALRRDNKTGDWLMTFTIATTDFPALVRDASPGQRFMLALVAIDSDEMPIHGGGSTEPPVDAGGEDASVPAQPAAPARKRWNELSRAQRAGMLCEGNVFCDWLRRQYPKDWEMFMGDPSEVVRVVCSVASRAEFDSPGSAAAARWDALETRFMQETGRMAVDR